MPRKSNDKFYLILHNIRSAYNVGSVFRTADGMGVDKIYLSGYTPCPAKPGDIVVSSAQKMISKTALGAEKNIEWERARNVGKLVDKLKKSGVRIVALEQDEKAAKLDHASISFPAALLAGNEVRGLDKRLLEKCDMIVEIPMRGKKKSLNVSVAVGIAGYRMASCRRSAVCAKMET